MVAPVGTEPKTQMGPAASPAADIDVAVQSSPVEPQRWGVAATLPLVLYTIRNKSAPLVPMLVAPPRFELVVEPAT